MTSEKVYLKQNLLIEPLVNQWYAWSYLISPATAAMYISNWHLKLMRSFVSNPHIHVMAIKSQKLTGGSFINHDPSKAHDIKDLIDKTVKYHSHILELADAIKTLEDTLMNEVDGSTLEPIYEKVPPALKGLVELVYDLNSHPSIRFLEGLIYKSKYYQPSLQSISLSLINQDERSFSLTTPKLKEKGHLHLEISFNAPEIDELFQMRYVPRSLKYIKEVLNILTEDEQLFSTFFTAEAPPEPPKYMGDAVRIRYFCHACILIETKNVSILIDPIVSYKYEHEVFRYTYADLPESIDYILITHSHQDHFVLETLLQLRWKTKHIIVPKNSSGRLEDPSLKFILQNIGFRNVIELDEMESVQTPDGHITGLPFFGEHGDLYIRSKLAYWISLNGKSIMCVADSNNIEPELYTHLRELTGEVDVLFIGMECDGAPFSWLYGPLLTKQLSRKINQSRRLDGSDAEQAIDIVTKFKPKQVYVYAMGQETWTTHLTSIKYSEESRPIVESNKLVEDCQKRGIVTERLFGNKEVFL